MVERPATIETERLLLLVLLPHELETLVAGDAERAGRLAGVNFPPGWPEEREAREVRHDPYPMADSPDRRALLAICRWLDQSEGAAKP